MLNAQQSSIPGPQAVLIRLRRDASPRAALRSLHEIIYKLNHVPNDPSPAGGLVAHLRPAEIANYRTMGTTPAILGGGLALGAVAALALTLVAVGASTTSRARPIEDARLRPSPTRGGRRVAVEHRRRDRCRGRCAGRYPARPDSLGPVRARDRRGADAGRTRRGHRPHRGRAPSCSPTSSPAIPGRMAAGTSTGLVLREE